MEQFVRGQRGTVVEIDPGPAGAVWVLMDLDGFKYPINFAEKYLQVCT